MMRARNFRLSTPRRVCNERPRWKSVCPSGTVSRGGSNLCKIPVCSEWEKAAEGFRGHRTNFSEGLFPQVVRVRVKDRLVLCPVASIAFLDST